MNKRLIDDDIASDPVQTAEDDGFRSAHVCDLVQRPAPTKSPPNPPHIPRVIVQFWDDSSVFLVTSESVLTVWQPLTKSGFTRLLFDDSRANQSISRVFGPTFVAAFDRCHHPAMRADYFRLSYVLARGGFYVDADEFYLDGSCDELLLNNMLKVQPLCYDRATNSMVLTEVFLEKQAFSSDWICYVNSSPLVAPPLHPVIRLALARATRILLNESGHLEIQSTTGPGNLTANLVRYSLACQMAGTEQDFSLLSNWEAISTSRGHSVTETTFPIGDSGMRAIDSQGFASGFIAREGLICTDRERPQMRVSSRSDRHSPRP